MLTLLLFLQVAVPHLPRGYQPPPTAEWVNGAWTCPFDYKLPPTLPSHQEAEEKKITIPCIKLQHDALPTWNDSEPHGIWDVPQSLLEFFYMETSLDEHGHYKHLIWKHYKVYFPSTLLGRNPHCHVQNSTHRLPYYFDHDPKNLVLKRDEIVNGVHVASFEFDAVAGDSIEWRVYGQ